MPRIALSNLLLLLGGLAMALLFAEVALRVVGFTDPNFYVVDDTLGFVLRPGTVGWYRQEGESYVRINSQGLRNREHPLSKPTDTLRIGVLGDSYSEALQVPAEMAFWAVTEREFAACPPVHGQQVEVMNFGVSGYGTAQELLMLRERVWQYDPDVVVLAVTTGNDISDNSRALKQDVRVPYFVHQGGSLVLDDSFRTNPGFEFEKTVRDSVYPWLYDRSRALQLVRNVRYSLMFRQRESRVATLVDQPYREPNDATWSEAWKVTEDLIVTMHREVQERGAKLLVVTLSNDRQVDPDPLVRQDTERRLGVPDLFYPDRRIEAVAQRGGIPFLTLAPTFQEYAQEQQVYLHGFEETLGQGHWNEQGHRLGGIMIAQKLCRDVLPE